MLIKEIMDTAVTECTEDTLLADVYDLIQNGEKDYVVEIDSSQHRVPIGIVNEHSICENLIRQSRNSKRLYAGSVMSSKIERICEEVEVENCRELIVTDADAIVVVSDRRQFRGVLAPVAIRECFDRQDAAMARRSFFSGVLDHAIPARVEIPAFGWLK
jgi:predicted transcriptional regulator